MLEAILPHQAEEADLKAPAGSVLASDVLFQSGSAFMLVRKLGHLALLTAASAAIAITGLSAPASATAERLACPIFFVCVYSAASTNPELIPEGDSHTFPAGFVMTGIVNSTTGTRYCVTGSPSFGLSPQREVVHTQPVTRVAPGGVCAQ
ncbi:hypothetical protein ACQP2T_05665 [Nonomuraea sp. CA-143628]|uniref:hypothetical protein n=1 Tax=Nonomuraea sp. CA-143628 TaxID=3239997 RepID=UPI003D912BC2